MKTGTAAAADAAPIVALSAADTLPAHLGEDGAAALARARAFAEPLLAGRALDSGEDAWTHAQGVAEVLGTIGAPPGVQAAAYLVYAGDWLTQPEEVVGKAFGSSYAALVTGTRKLVQLQRAAREAQLPEAQQQQQIERVRKMLLAFSRDLRVVLLRLASRLQTLRWFAATRRACPPDLAREAQQVFAPLANRLGIWQIKWEMEDLAFRFLRPEDYHRLARQLDEKRAQREAAVEHARQALASLLAGAGVTAEVAGRPKHLYSIWKKMHGKQLPLDQVFDLSALRVIVDDVPACYTALARVHERWSPLPDEFDDYIARPKPNGYQSLHTVVRLDDARVVEVQIRTREMHEHAEFGVAAHWAYKEAGTRGYAGVSAAGADEAQIAEARKAVLRQLLAWERDLSEPQGERAPADEGRIYVFTPQAAIIELPEGGTPVDFAYHLHSDLGHRCRGARVDGALVPLNTPLASGQTVDIVVAKEGAPSRDWLNPELGYLKSARSRAKVRAWFNAEQQGQTIARGRELVEKLLQREGRTAVKLDALADQLGFKDADALFEVVGKDEFSLRHIEQLLRPQEPPADDDEVLPLKRSRSAAGGVLVVGVDSLLTTLARCCRPVPPDPIAGFVTRGKGVAIHRRDCSNFRHMAAATPGRVIDVAWEAQAPAGGRAGREALYPLDVLVEAADRPGLLRDITEIFAKERLNVTGVQSQSARDAQGRVARMCFTVEVPDGGLLHGALAALRQLPGIRHARRR
ncbi:MAG: bifunctional (p)ppGpp synthetase/guanosine-3',5'-bis(diphosphate) 3'-pyrophosphohydrolase [Burkholderiaceae bacterium]|nr:bifunctional (p)ppGpp synthetase/guanosine-3',5'-bis(diphosphate) 3'-pyrophosphohydrolase [Rhodoferax sp.]MCP5284275.1 bifunctional (p)ppGpp synthetase/guanosine-3',5'-bis(diphosphate) 3'-pyrophosphohydrolase [Burkholderiaceae bacterium]